MCVCNCDPRLRIRKEHSRLLLGFPLIALPYTLSNPLYRFRPNKLLIFAIDWKSVGGLPGIRTHGCTMVDETTELGWPPFNYSLRCIICLHKICYSRRRNTNQIGSTNNSHLFCYTFIRSYLSAKTPRMTMHFSSNIFSEKNDHSVLLLLCSSTRCL